MSGDRSGDHSQLSAADKYVLRNLIDRHLLPFTTSYGEPDQKSKSKPEIAASL